jgi:hypothetical protein
VGVGYANAEIRGDEWRGYENIEMEWIGEVKHYLE